MGQRNRWLRLTLYFFATVQLVWCYLWLTRPYVNTLLYEQGRERMPFQGRCLMMLPLRLAHGSSALQSLSRPFARSHFWFPKPVQPEVLVQAFVDVLCLLISGFLLTRIYEAASPRKLLTPLVYPLLLVVFAATYIMHTVQNFRFLYDLPSLAFVSGAMYLIYFRHHWGWFAALFAVGTINRETTLLFLPLYAIDASLQGGNMRWRRVLQPRVVLLVLLLLTGWTAWEVGVRHLFAHNRSEFYPRLNWNVKSLLVPQAWPQLLSACGFLLPFVLLLRQHIRDTRLRSWLWLFPFWLLFMFAYGILVETRVFGELIPLVVCSTTLILEELLLHRMSGRVPAQEPSAEAAILPLTKVA